MQQRVHAVVLNYNNSAAALRARNELRNARGIEVDVLVADCNSADADRAALREQLPAERLLLLQENRGYAGGMNAGVDFWLERAPDVPVLLLTPDAHISADVPATLWDALAGEPRVGVVGPVIVYQQQPRRIGAGVSVDEHGRVIRITEIRQPEPYDVSSIDGCCMLLHPDAFRAVNGLDERYFLYFEETDLCHRIRNAGWRVCVVPSALVHHPKDHSSTAPHVAYYMARNSYLFRTANFKVSSWRAGIDLAMSNLRLTGVAIGASLWPKRWHEARSRWRSCLLGWQGMVRGTWDHLQRHYGPQNAL